MTEKMKLKSFRKILFMPFHLKKRLKNQEESLSTLSSTFYVHIRFLKKTLGDHEISCQELLVRDNNDKQTLVELCDMATGKAHENDFILVKKCHDLHPYCSSVGKKYAYSCTTRYALQHR